MSWCREHLQFVIILVSGATFFNSSLRVLVLVREEKEIIHSHFLSFFLLMELVT